MIAPQVCGPSLVQSFPGSSPKRGYIVVLGSVDIQDSHLV